MNDFAKTGLFVAVAAGLVWLAGMVGPSNVTPELFSDEGEEFFAEFTDPFEATELEVWQFDEAISDVKPFSVKKNDRDVWIIPSHYGYPADAKARMATSATMLVGLKKDRVVGDRKEDHALFGVVNPLEDSFETEGRGTLVTFKNSGGSKLAELIVGKEVEDKVDHFYVRLPGKKRTYVASLDNQLSTQFADWIETDLLKASALDVDELIFDNYSVDEQRGEIIQGERIVARRGADSEWLVEGAIETEESNTQKLHEIGATLSELEIVGVRRKPEGLTGLLQQAQGFDRMALIGSLRGKGYFLAGDGALVSNEGDLEFHTKKGVKYTLKFGEIAYGVGDAVTSGAEAAAAEPGADGPQPLPGNNRYLMVTAEFDESLLDKPEGDRWDADELATRGKARSGINSIVQAINMFKVQNDGKLPESLAQLAEPAGEGQAPLLAELAKDPWEQDYVFQPTEDSFVVMSYGADQQAGGEGPAMDIHSDQLQQEDELARLDSDWQAFDSKVEAGKEEAAKLTTRFGPWYYVIDEEMFGKLKPKREDLVKPKPEGQSEDGAAPGDGK